MRRKIGILTIALPDNGGVYQYTLSLIEALKLYGSKDKYKYVQIRYPEFPKFFDEEIVIKKLKSSFILKFKRIIYAYTSFNLGNLIPEMPAELSDIDLIVSPVITLLPYYISKPYIITIHDFQHKYYPHFFTFRERLFRRLAYKSGRFASIVIVESNYVKKDAIKYLGIDEKKVKVLLSPPPSYITQIKMKDNILMEVKEKYKLPCKYLFYPAHFWYHKNHLKLLESLHLIRQKHGMIMPLVLVGSEKNNFNNVMRKIDELGLREIVRYLGYVPDEDMPYLYKLSTALVMPTLFESVSIPIWEAFYLGVPVVSSNVCALPEQVGDAGLLFNPDDVEDMANKIYKVWTDESLRKELIRKGYVRVRDLTLENYAKEWEKIVEEFFESQGK